ncbi:hypothetical protein KY366_02660 [Candidatus Woesearchaeota archaeon]|nr:hypothetical protein [Candidatus Woesearchaeota archaeon]
MKVIHSIGSKRIEKEVKDEAGFLLGNRMGGYCWLCSSPESRYQGVFFNADNRMYKVIDEIRVDDTAVSALRNNFSDVERKRGDVTERFFMPHNFNSLVYRLDKKKTVEIILDIRESYSSPEWGRFYDVYEENGRIIVRYNEGGFEAYLVIGSDPDHERTGRWLKRHYSFDEKRGSLPFEMYVYSALKIRTDKIVFTFSRRKEDALKENDVVLKRLGSLEEKQRDFFRRILRSDVLGRINDKELFFAYLSAVNSLENLVMERDSGVYAGFPWFFQFWTRDELISLKALLLSGHDRLAKGIIRKAVNAVMEDGNLPNQLPSSALKGADSVGWLFKGMADMAGYGNLEKPKEKLKEKLAGVVELLLKNHTRDCFALNDGLETWMDTSYMGDSRKGARIEIQALRLGMYKLMHRMTGDPMYLNLEIGLKEKVRRNMWDKVVLADGFGDFTARPNVFIAAYAYPFLLTDDEWARCFEKIISGLWAEWGGLATIDKKSPLFMGRHTGQDNRSYHRGDSWFWVNNLAALALYRVDKNRFKEYIDKILRASVEEILYKGAIGNASEVSSADKLESDGCVCQAFSSAMFIELVHAVFGD